MSGIGLLLDKFIRHLRHPGKHGRIALSLGVISGAIFVINLVSPAEPKLTSEQINLPVDGVVAVDFDKNISVRSIKAGIYPEVPGRWDLGGKQATHRITFTPEQRFVQGTQYKIVVLGTRNYVSKLRTAERELTFVTERPPNALKATGYGKEAVNFHTGGHISVVLERENRLRKFRFEISPQVPARMVEKGAVLNVMFDEPLKQGAKYEYKIFDENIQADDKTFITGAFTTVFPPRIESMSPLGTHIHIDTPIRIKFAEPMNKSETEANFKLEPKFPGNTSWLSDNEFEFKHDNFPYATNYTFTLAAGTRTIYGGVLEADVQGAFTTIGPVVIAATSPAGGSGGVGIGANVSVTFDQEVDQGSAQSKFSITPNVGGAFSWSGNTMTYDPSGNLGYSTRYSVRIAAGVKSIYGQDMTNEYEFSFTTQAAVTILSVPTYYQQYALSCEESSLRAALARYGIYDSDWNILQRVGYAPRSRDSGSNSWDHPQYMFVGDVRGRQNSTGYGVHWNPIANAARSYGRGATAFSGWSRSQLAQEIANGHPVIIWGVYGKGTNDGWNTPYGWSGNTPKGEHTRTVIGFYGTVSNPTSFILVDPLAGRITWSASTLSGNWGWFGNSGVVVY